MSATVQDCWKNGVRIDVLAKLSSHISFSFGIIKFAGSSLGLTSARLLEVGLDLELCDTSSCSWRFVGTEVFDISLTFNCFSLTLY